MIGSCVSAPQRIMRDGSKSSSIRQDKAEILDEGFQRAIRRTVIDDDHFELWVVERQQRPHTLNDGQLFVEGWRDDRNGYRRPALSRPHVQL